MLPIISSSPGASHGALVPIASIYANTVTGAFQFTSIPQNYQDLRLVIYGASSRAATNDQIAGAVNGSGASIYSDTQLKGDGASATSSRYTATSYITVGYTPGASSTNIFGATTFDILNYANTSTYKTMITRSAADLNGSGTTTLDISLFQTTSAITSIQFNPLGGGWIIGSRASLYGIRSAGQ